jgi:hypothetical protein
MAKKTKKSLRQIQDALLTNTGLLKQPMEAEPEPQPVAPFENLIDDEIMEKIELLAEFEKTTSRDMINKALHHYIKLKGIQLEQAMKLNGK